jgi:hypothetical protein
MSQIILYQSEDGSTKLDVRLDDQTIWLSQKQLTELYGKAKGTISEHIKHIFEDGELEKAATVRLFRTVQVEGDREVSRDGEFSNLECGADGAIFSIGALLGDHSPLTARNVEQVRQQMPRHHARQGTSPQTSCGKENRANRVQSGRMIVGKPLSLTEG